MNSIPQTIFEQNHAEITVFLSENEYKKNDYVNICWQDAQKVLKQWETRKIEFVGEVH